MANSPSDSQEHPVFFLDSSVSLSGLISKKGASHVLLALGELSMLRLLTIPYALAEVEKNLVKKFPSALPDFERLLASGALINLPDPSFQDLEAWNGVVPEKDVFILAAAVASPADCLITLDRKHFIDDPQVAEKTGLTILTPGDVLKTIRGALVRAFKKE